MVNEDRDWMVVGRIVGAFGVRGEMKVSPLTDYPERLTDITDAVVGPTRKRIVVENARAHQNLVLFRIAGIETPEQVQMYVGQEVLLPREKVAPLPQGHFYLEDVLGIHAFDKEGRALGPVVDVLRTGANEVFVVDSAGENLLIPVIQSAILNLDLEKRSVVIDDWVLQPPM